jgi:flagellar basal body-associated protein FliL
MAAENESTDDMVSLEDLVRESSEASGPPVEQSVALIDQVLEVEDPGFAAELDKLKAAGTMPGSDVALDVVLDVDIDQILRNERVEQAAKGRKRLRLLFIVRPWRKMIKILSSVKEVGPWIKLSGLPWIKMSALATLTTFKKGLSWSTGRLKAGATVFSKQSKQSKVLVFAVGALALAAGAMIRVAVHGSFLPTLERNFVYSFAPIADHSFTFGNDEKWQDLNDPLLHPEHIVLLERLIVNLRSPGDGSNPMALLDLYIETGSQETAIELKERDSEVRDLVLRTMEQMGYDELVTDAGKNKLKVFLRKNLNELMSSGRIRRIFFKSIVLKP